ncbi:MAG TPA: hypothetical protein VMZ28_21850 [Kofleriaceae bacterium]|nr:hypothetical protein [Kofleriaceae bacterium]
MTDGGASERTGRRALVAAAPALVLLLIALWEIVAVERATARAATEDDWQRLSTAVRERHRPSDLIVFAPGWIDPLGREHLGDLIPVEMAARMDAARYDVVWEVALGDARAPETEGLEPDWSGRFGRLTARRYQREPEAIAADLVQAFPQATVEGKAAGTPAVSLEEVGFAPHRCVKVIPRPGETVSIVYRDVELGRRLVGYVGLADVFTRRDVRAPGQLTVRVGGAQVAEVTAGVEDGWIRFEAPTSGGTGEIRFEATAVGRDARDRRICFAAETRR